MCNLQLMPLIKKFKKQDMSVFPLIYDEFKKLIFLYSAKLEYEDAQSDMNLFFIELLYAIDLSIFKCDKGTGIKRYIAVCLRNRYITLSIKADKLKKLSLPYLENSYGYCGEYDDKILMDQALEELTSKQKCVLIHRYVYGYSIAEISENLKITRQTVNDTKNRALSSLKEFFKE